MLIHTTYCAIYQLLHRKFRRSWLLLVPCHLLLLCQPEICPVGLCHTLPSPELLGLLCRRHALMSGDWLGPGQKAEGRDEGRRPRHPSHMARVKTPRARFRSPGKPNGSGRGRGCHLGAICMLVWFKSLPLEMVFRTRGFDRICTVEPGALRIRRSYPRA